MRTEFPAKGTPWEDLKRTMVDMGANDIDWRHGRNGMYVFYAGEDVLRVAKEAYTLYMSENGLGPMAFPSLKQMESDVISMGLSLLNAPEDGAGSMTSGGTESIMLGVKTARDYAASLGKNTVQAEVVVPFATHLAFDKACHFLGLKIVRVPQAEDRRANVKAMEAAITDRTIMLVGSAPAYPFGLIDPISDLSDLAEKHDLWLHVDACVGGYLAPFVTMNGTDLDIFDFRNPGVKSMSADLHKYGYCAKGASTILYRDKSLFEFQKFDCDTWPSGRMVTPSLGGTRPGGAISAAWAVMNYLGVEGYRAKAKIITQTRGKLQAAIEAIDGLEVFGDPKLGIICFGSPDFDVNVLWGKLFERGWFLSLTTEPKGIHLMMTPAHEQSVDQLISDLEELVPEVRASSENAEAPGFRYS
ncbi:MAG: aspartate aminotransferase family protein [Alphaproteobacteria bacterium]|nr:MAG: aspartate aminotransferase family protein [Alphaproteobacteria bacterium]